MKKRVKVVGIILGLIILLMLVIFTIILMQMGSAINDLEYYEVHLEELEDGLYNGSVETPLVKVKVEVEVKDSEIVEIDLIDHQNGLGSDAEIIIDDMVDQNTYEVDAISGATASSEVIKSAVSKALTKDNIEK